MAETRVSYVYVIFRPNGEPCYVGKGKKNRHKTNPKYRNNHLRRIYEKYGELPTVKVREGLTDAEAIKTEIAWIAALGRRVNGGPLVNMTDGGDGMAGWVPNEETRKRIGNAKRGLKHTDECRRKMSEASKGRKKGDAHRANIQAGLKAVWASEDVRLRASEKATLRWEDLDKRDQHSEALRKVHASMTEEERAARSLKISIATKAAMAKKNSGKKISQSRAGKPLTDKQLAVIKKMADINRESDHVMTEVRQKSLDAMHNGNIGKNHSEETKAKMRASHAKRKLTG